MAEKIYLSTMGVPRRKKELLSNRHLKEIYAFLKFLFSSLLQPNLFKPVNCETIFICPLLEFSPENSIILTESRETLSSSIRASDWRE